MYSIHDRCMHGHVECTFSNRKQLKMCLYNYNTHQLLYIHNLPIIFCFPLHEPHGNLQLIMVECKRSVTHSSVMLPWHNYMLHPKRYKGHHACDLYINLLLNVFFHRSKACLTTHINVYNYPLNKLRSRSDRYW